MIFDGDVVQVANGGFRGRALQVWIARYRAGKSFLLDTSKDEPFWAEVPEGKDYPPTVRISDDAAQDLIDRLWQCGFRPTQGKQSEGQMAATTKHLEDMRQIAFAKLNIPKI